MKYESLEDMLVAAAEAVRPAERITVSEAAERYHIVKNPGQHEGPFSLEKAPYLVEPMDVLTSLDFEGMVFIGPARTGKSAMFINWLCHTAITDPTDMMIVHMAQHTAREWSQTDLAKAIRNSPELKKRMTPGRQNDNVFDKHFISGMRLGITWPTITNLSGKTIPKTWIMDYDREPIDIDKEGDKWTLTKKRSDTFGRYRMNVAETSPGHPVNDPKWMPETPHEAPPCDGLLSVYNDGDRRRWYWRCPQCKSAFEPHRKHLVFPDSDDPMECAEQVVMVCPNDGFPMEPEMQRELNLGGRWVKEGQMWVPHERLTGPDTGKLVGEARRSPIASFWMFGPAAAFTDWGKLVYRLRAAQLKFDKTGSEESEKTVITTDFGEAYVLKATQAARLPEELKDRAEDWGGSAEYPVVPEDVVFLIKTADVQSNAFVIQTHGFTAEGDVAFVDMKKLRKSESVDDNGERLPLDPAARQEDWDLLIAEIEQTYPLNDGSGRQMQIKMMGCDSGGKAGVTARAYNFWRKLRTERPELAARFHLIKGTVSKGAPRISVTWPDSNRKDRHAGARGEIPVQLVQTNEIKDQVSAMLGRAEPGGRMRFPIWAKDWLYTQLTTEVRDHKGWSNPSRRRNEALDLVVYAIALSLHPDINFERINWESPPGFAKDWDDNLLVFGEGEEPNFRPKPMDTDIADLASRLG